MGIENLDMHIIVPMQHRMKFYLIIYVRCKKFMKQESNHTNKCLN